MHRHALVQQQIVLLQILLSHHSVLSQFRFVLLFLRQSNVRYHEVPLLMIGDSLAQIFHCHLFHNFRSFLSVFAILFGFADESVEPSVPFGLKLQMRRFLRFQNSAHLTGSCRKNQVDLPPARIHTLKAANTLHSLLLPHSMPEIHLCPTVPLPVPTIHRSIPASYTLQPETMFAPDYCPIFWHPLHTMNFLLHKTYSIFLPTLLFLPAILASVCKQILVWDQSMSHQIYVLIWDDFLSHQAAQYCVLRS